MGSFDAGYGSTLLARIVGHKKASEIWYLCRQYNAQEALDMGLVNTVVPLAELEDTAIQWAREILEKSPMAIRFLKAAFNADTDGLAGLQQLAGDATLLYYLTDEAKEGRNAFVEKRKPDFSRYPAVSLTRGRCLLHRFPPVAATLGSGCSPRARRRCRRRSCRSWSAPRSARHRASFGWPRSWPRSSPRR